MDQRTKVTIRDLMLPMSDGVRLYTRIVLPENGAGRYPFVFMRTPYDQEVAVTEETVCRYEADPFLMRGFGVLMQHCRGRYGSEGECVPYSPEERSDGLETLAWLRKQTFYNGELYLNGTSYTASVLMMMLNEPIPDLKAIAFSVQTESMYHRNYVNGLCRSFAGFSWYLSMIAGAHPKIQTDDVIYRRPYKELMKRAVGTDLKAFTESLLHERYDDYWKNDPRTGIMERLGVPILMVGGWFDYYCYGMCRMWEKLPEATRKQSVFLMSPFGHGMSPREDSDYVFPNGLLPKDRIPAWFESVRTGRPYPYGKPGQFRYYSIGEDRWKCAESPYRTGQETAFYFGSDGHLTRTPPTSGAKSFLYDPDHPTHHDKHDVMCFVPPENSFEDVLSFVSEPFEEEAAFFGPIGYRLEIATDCEDTAFFLRFCLVEDGKAYNLVDAATTVLHMDPEYRAGARTTLTFQSQPTAFCVKKGGRIRVDLTSYSDCFAPHPNTREPFALAVRTKIANNTFFFGSSSFSLPKALPH